MQRICSEIFTSVYVLDSLENTRTKCLQAGFAVAAMNFSASTLQLEVKKASLDHSACLMSKKKKKRLVVGKRWSPETLFITFIPQVSNSISVQATFAYFSAYNVKPIHFVGT